MIEAVWEIFATLAPWLLLGAAVAGLLELLLPPGLLHRQLTGRRGVARAVALGVPLPLCSCGVIPTGLGLKKQGAGDGATIGFLISTPQTGVDSVLVTAAFLGLPFALFKVAWAALTGLVGGWLAEANAPRPATQPLPVLGETAPRHRWREGWNTAIELLRSIWLWVVAGVLVSAAITYFVPTDQLTALSGYGGVPGMLAALVISLPLYVCATASVPIAASLVTAGLPAGAALVFLMAGPATNVATIGAVYRTLGGKQLVVYLATIIAGSIIGGLAFGWLVEPAAGMPTHEHAPLLWDNAAAVVTALLFARFAFDELRARITRKAPAELPADMSIEVEGMTCQGCVAKLERTLAKDPAVTEAWVTLTPGRAEVRGTLSLERLRSLVRAAGFSPRG